MENIFKKKIYYTTVGRTYDGYKALFGNMNIQTAKDLARYQKALEKEMAKVNANKIVIAKYKNKIKAIDEYLSSDFYKEWASVKKEDIYRIAEAIAEGNVATAIKAPANILRQM